MFRRFAVASLCLLAAQESLAQVPYNRYPTGIAVIPTSAPGRFDVLVASTFTVEGTTAPLNLSMEIHLSVNGTTTAADIVPILVNGPGGFCGVGGCGGSCGNSTIDGLANDLFCVSSECDCRPLDFVSAFPSIPLNAGDELAVVVFPAGGALPEPDSSDDFRRLVFQGGHATWDRRIDDVRIRPDARDPGVYSIDVFFSAGVAGQAGLQRLDTEVAVFVNGAQQGLEGGCLDWIVANTGSPCAVNCDEPTCGDWSCNGDSDARCRPFDSPQGGYCACATDSIYVEVPSIRAQPGDEVQVVLRAAPGGLPTLPPLAGDESFTLAVPEDCPDLDGDNFVGLSDLSALLTAYGLCDPAPGYDSDLDLDGDGCIGLGDLSDLLSAYGTSCR